MNVAFQASGKILGLNSKLIFVSQNKGIFFCANLDTNDCTISQVLYNPELGIADILEGFDFTKKLDKNFSLEVFKGPSLTSFEFLYDVDYKKIKPIANLYCNLILLGETRHLVFAMNTILFKDSKNSFGSFVYNALNFLNINRLSLILRNSADLKVNEYLKTKANNYIPSVLLDDKTENTLLVNSTFDLINNQTVLAKSLYLLTGIESFQLLIAASRKTSSFKALLFAENIDKESYNIERLSFGIEISKTFKITAEGKLSFKLDNKNLDFTIAGEVSPISFTLSASSTCSIPLNNKISISNLGLIIGVSSGVIFGMTGRATLEGKNNYKMSFFAGFIIDIATPKINLLTTALTSSTGKISLKDIIVNIAEIEFPGVEALDLISLQDFELKTENIQNWSANNSKKTILEDFNSVVPQELTISSEDKLQISTLSDSQVIITDQSTMRHFKVDSSGNVSLNCQIYICTQSTKIGEYEMPEGFFLCGTLEIFEFKSRALFLIEPGNSIIALVEFSPIVIKNIIEFRRSNKSLPICAIQAGLAGALIKPDAEGPVFYLNINKEKGLFEVYLNAYLNILNIFKLDTLVLIKDRKIYIDSDFELIGLKLLISLNTDYSSFSQGSFNAKIVFDTTEFSKILDQAQESIKRAALAVQNKVENANRDLEEAKATILNLKNNISNYQISINEYSNKRSNTSWWKVNDKIWYSTKILYFEGLKLGVKVALGVAYGVLEVAQLALNFGGTLVTSVLNGIANIISSIKNLFWINRFELAVICNANEKRISAFLDLRVFGNNLMLSGEINLDKAVNNLKAIVSDFVKEKVFAQTQDITTNIANGNITRNVFDQEEFHELSSSYLQIDNNKAGFYELLDFQNSLDDFLVDSTALHFTEFSAGPDKLQKNLVELSEIKLQNDIIKNQCVEAFDDDFVKSLDDVVGYIKENQTSKNINDKLITDISNLSSFIKDINIKSKTTRIVIEKRSLFDRINSNIEKANDVSRSKKEESFDIEDSNKNYADGLSHLLKLLPKSNNIIIEEFKTQIASDIFRFKNPPNTIDIE
jgi:hypothetical protein